jgi:3-dehydroquinate dehydratase-1
VRLGDRLLGGPEVLVCVPLVAADRDALAGQVAQLGALRPDCLEWRSDYLADLEPGHVAALVGEVAAAAGCPLIFTNRFHEEGGFRPQTEEARSAILAAAAATGVPALVDVEMATPPEMAEHVRSTARRNGVGVIRSWHDFSSTPPPEALLSVLRTMQEAGADVAKVAVTPRSPEDVISLLQAGLEARRSFLEIPCVLVSMGPLGAASRLFGGHFGSDLTFAAGNQGSAAGQLDLDLVRRCLAALGLAWPRRPSR